jgi:hypothetical protein
MPGCRLFYARLVAMGCRLLLFIFLERLVFALKDCTGRAVVLFDEVQQVAPNVLNGNVGLLRY